MLRRFSMLIFFVSLFVVVIASAAMATMAGELIGRAGFPLPAIERRLGCVDGLRGYLALAVLAHHFVIWTQATQLGGGWPSPTSTFINQLGAGSVGLFFMATGLVFYPRVVSGIRATSWRALYVTRVARIMPLVCVASVLVALIIYRRIGHVPDRHFPGLFARWVLAWGEPDLLGYPHSGQINAHVLWSLWYEWLFYLFVLPLCAAAADIARRLGRPVWFVPVALFAVGIIGGPVIVSLGGAPGIVTYLPLFASGMIAFELRAIASVRARLASWPMAILSGGALLVGMSLWREPYGGALPFFAIFFACVAAGNDFGGILRRRGAAVLGECSFGIYLLHGIVLDILFVDGRSLHPRLAMPLPLFLLCVVTLIVMIVTPATYLVIERPAIGAGRALARRFGRRVAAAGSLEAELAP